MKQLIPALFVVGAIMALAGAAVFITGWAYAPYIYTVGAGFIALAQVNTPIKGKSKTLKRLRIQQIFGALALILTGAFMSYNCRHTRTLYSFPHPAGRRERKSQLKKVLRILPSYSHKSPAFLYSSAFQL